MSIRQASVILISLVVLSGCEKLEPVQVPKPAPGESNSSSSKPPANGASSGNSSSTSKQPKPTVSPVETTTDPLVSEIDQEVAKRYPMPNYPPLDTLLSNWQNVPQKLVDAIPAIAVQEDTTYKLVSGERVIGSTVAKAGHRAKPLRFKPGKLMVTNSSDGKMRAVVDIDDTTFKAEVTKLYLKQVENGKKRVLAQREVARKAMTSVGREGFKGQSVGDPRFLPVRRHLASGKLKSGKLEEAKHWLWLGQETHKGQTFNAVLVSFEVQTIFGTFPNSMKALLIGDQVVKWVDAETGEERL